MSKLILPAGFKDARRAPAHVVAGIRAGEYAKAAPRAIQSFRPRADASDPAKILADLQKAVADLRAENKADIDAVRKDVVQAEKVDRINDEVGNLQRAIDEMNARLKAKELNGEGRGQRQVTEEQRAHTLAFQNYLRFGESAEANLKAAAVKASMTVGSDPDGGYLVPFEVDPTIDRVQAVQGGLISLATVREIKGDRYKKLTSQGGATAGWVGETEGRTSTSTPTLSEIEIVLGELYVNAPASQQVLDDGDVAGWLNDEVLVTFDEYENAAYATGNGIKRPRGLMSYSIVANASYAWGSVGYIASGGAADFAASNPWTALVDVQTALKQVYRPNASWIGNRTTVGKVRKFVDANGLPLWQPSLQLGQPQTILAHPVTEDDNFADVGANAYPLAYGDFRKAYTIVRKPGLAVNLRDPYTNKPYVMFYMVKRVGGGVTNFEAFKVLKIATS